MAFEIPGLTITRQSSGDMSAHQYKAVIASSANAAGGATVVATRGGALSGVWLGNSTSQEHGNVQVSGVAKLQAGDSSAMDNAITEGGIVVASSKGQAVPSTAAGQHVIGRALEPLTTGSTGIIAVQLQIGAIST
jgi:hypothetical protein